MGKVKDTVKAVTKAVKKAVNAPADNIYSMATQEDREHRCSEDFYASKNNKAGTVTKWKRLDEYYNNEHYTKKQIEELIAANNWNFVPPVLPDPFIQVESQIDATLPQAEFRGRDDDKDSAKAKERQAVMEYICYNNKIKQMIPENERNLNKLGNAFWKVAFDGTIKGFGYVGDIVIGNPAPAYIFPDHSAYDIDDCEFIIYSYRQHRRKARRIYGAIIDECGSNGFIKDTEIFDRSENNLTMLDDTVQIIEYWYKDDEGDIACSIQVDFKEVKYIPKYWINTRNSGNQRYPFIKYCKIPVDQSFWDKGEIETIIDLVDAADREFMSALLIDMMQPADIIVYEPNALAEGETISTGPNAMIKMKDNRIEGIRRLGNLGTNFNALQMIEFIHKKIEETTGNSLTNNGLEPTKVTTASGIAMMNERADMRKNIKKADRLTGFEKLYELIDWTALEFYNTDRVIMIRGQQETQDDGTFNDSTVFNSDNHKVADKAKAKALATKGVEQGKTDEEIQKILDENVYYFPTVDIEIAVGEGVSKSKSFTLQALSELIKYPITSQNVSLIKSQVDLLDLPNKKEIKDGLENFFKSQMSMPYLFKDMPRFQISFQDLPQDAQIQVMDQMGIKSQGGLSNDAKVKQNKELMAMGGQLEPIEQVAPQEAPAGTQVPVGPQEGNVSTEPEQASQDPQGIPETAPGGLTPEQIQQIEADGKLSPDELALFIHATPQQQQEIMIELNLNPEALAEQVKALGGNQ